MQNKIAFIAGTRPELVKISPLVKELNSVVIFTGQHFDKNMSDNFINLLQCEEIIYIKKNDNKSEEHLKNITKKISEIIEKTNIEKFVVQGDTNSTLAGSIAVKSEKKTLYFIESGMRSNDISQIEEYNRIITSHLADTNFCNHELNKNNLIREGINPEKIFVLGSTVYAAMSNMKISKLDNNIEKPYILLTLHRPENVDDPRHLDSLLKAVNSLNETIIFPMHPRTRKNIKGNLKKYKNIVFSEPTDYLNFLNLIQNSSFVISDSGGVQEEASILRKPLLIPRNHTERPEMLNIFNLLTPNIDILKQESIKLLREESAISNSVLESDFLYGENEVIENIINILNR
jgi:UDP-N-acetylglucosamine 2-epimerase (non-hydrolysing)